MNNLDYNDMDPWQGDQVVSVSDWLIVMVLMCIPLVNLVMPFVWAFGGGNIPESKKNWAKAMLIWGVIIIVLYFFLFAIIGINIMSPTDYGI